MVCARLNKSFVSIFTFSALIRVAIAQDVPSKYIASKEVVDQAYKGHGQILSSGSYSFDRVMELIRLKKISSVEELLKELPPQFKDNASFAFKSGSIQYSSPKNPRAILASTDGTFFLAFPGARDPSLSPEDQNKKFNQVEIVQLDKKTEKWVFKTIGFNKQPAGQPEVLEGHFKNSKGEKIACDSCHRGGPIWDAYPTWAGVYGMLNDSLEPGSKELNQYIEFLKNVEINPRYKAIYSKTSSINLERGVDYKQKTYYSILRHTNNNMNRRINYQNLMRLYRLLKKNYPERKYAIGAALIGCPNLAEFIPPKDRGRFRAQFSVILQDTENHFKDNIEDIKTRILATEEGKDLSENPNSTFQATFEDHLILRDKGDLTYIAGLRYVLQDIRFDWDQFATSKEKWTFFMADSNTVADPIVVEALKDLAKESPVFAKFIKEHSPHTIMYEPYQSEACSVLKRLNAKVTNFKVESRNSAVVCEDCAPKKANSAEAELNPELSNVSHAVKKLAVPAVAKDCAICHTTDGFPSIPFGNPEALKKELSRSMSSGGTLAEEIFKRMSIPKDTADSKLRTQRMPAGDDPRSPTQIAKDLEEMREYIRSLSGLK